MVVGVVVVGIVVGGVCVQPTHLSYRISSKEVVAAIFISF